MLCKRHSVVKAFPQRAVYHAVHTALLATAQCAPRRSAYFTAVGTLVWQGFND